MILKNDTNLCQKCFERVTKEFNAERQNAEPQEKTLILSSLFECESCDNTTACMILPNGDRVIKQIPTKLAMELYVKSILKEMDDGPS